MNFTTVNGTGTGEYDLSIRTVDGIPLGQSFLNEPQQPGVYTVSWSVTAAPDDDCDPTEGPCEMWLPGNYTVNVGKKVYALLGFKSFKFHPLLITKCSCLQW